MNPNFYATKDRPRSVSGGRHHRGGEQHRREMRAALHDLQQRLGQRHDCPSGMRVVITAGLAPSIGERIKTSMFQKLRSFYTIFTPCALP
jgi:hypothetical protein